MAKYKFEKVAIKERYYEVFIKADSNDADYITTTMKFDQKEFDETIDELINLKNNYGGSHELSNYPNDLDLDIPFADDSYCHTLIRLSVKMYDTDGSIYIVTF